MRFPKPCQIRGKKNWNVRDGIKYVTDKVTGLIREQCVTTAARARRRQEVFNKAGGKCESCGLMLRYQAHMFERDAFHWHHEQHKGMGGAWTDDSLSNARCLCRDCHLITEHKQF